MKTITALAFLVAAASSQAVILYSTGFESPWAAGTNGSSVISAANTAQGWASGSTGATVVANGQTNAGGVTAYAGTQMMRMTTSTAAGNANWAWKDLSGGWASRPSGDNTLHAQTKAFIPTGNNRTTTYGIQAYTTAVDVVGEILFVPNYDASNSFIYLASGTWNDTTTFNYIGYTIPKATLRGAWFGLDLYTNMATSTASGFLTLGSTTYYLGSVALDPTQTNVGIGDLDFFAGNPSSGSQTGTTAAANSVYFDNYGVETVPEPATMAALGLGLAAVIRRRKK
ncbi:MAG: PEP-CTERM sorting domain-containing protein [Armatimonadetes bacterium]|nr:PEP-CTERM sorting domain-containing protein [Armatimonadota bacterium]